MKTKPDFEKYFEKELKGRPRKYIIANNGVE
jgi:hypothetical protein